MHTPIEVRSRGMTLTFRVIPEQPAIARASMTVYIVAEAIGSSTPQALGFVQMSAANARAFLTDLRNERSPIVVTGDEDGTVQIEYEITEAGPVLSVRTLGGQDAKQRVTLDRAFNLKIVANELLADLGA
jgi:hypothetical protein